MAELAKSYCQQYAANVHRMASQRGSKLRNLVSNVELKGKAKFFDRIHQTQVQQYSGRFADSPTIETKFSRRKLEASEWHWGDMIDWGEDLKIFFDPTSDIVRVGANAFGKKIDEIILSAMSGSAWEGEEGKTEVPFPTSQIIPITAGAGSENKGLTIEKLIRAKSLFGKNDIDESDPAFELYMAVTQNQLDDLLRTTEVTSSEYNTVRALVNGEIDKFMGFKFVRMAANSVVSGDESGQQNENLITWGLKGTAVSGGISRECIAWSKSYIKFATPQDVSMRIAEREDKCFNWYAYGRMSAGAIRIEDAGVVKIACFES